MNNDAATFCAGIDGAELMALLHIGCFAHTLNLASLAILISGWLVKIKSCL